MAHGRSRHLNQIPAVIKRDQLHAARKPAIVKTLHLPLELPQSRQGLFASLQENDPLNGIVVVVYADLSEARLRSFIDFRYIAQVNGHAISRGDENVFHLSDGAEKAQAADVDALIAHGQIIAADVGVARADSGNDLGQGHVVLQQFLRINFRDVFARAAAKGRDIDNSRNLLDLALDEPIFRSLQFVERVSGTGQAITIDFSYGRPGRKLRGQVCRQSDLLQAVQGLLAVPQIIAVIVEIEFHIAQSKNGDRADILKMRDSKENRLNRNGDLPLHFFRGPRRILRNYFHQGRRRVRIRFDVELQENHDSARDPGKQYDDHQRPITQQGGYELAHFGLALSRGAQEESSLRNNRITWIYAGENLNRTVHRAAQLDGPPFEAPVAFRDENMRFIPFPNNG